MPTEITNYGEVDAIYDLDGVLAAGEKIELGDASIMLLPGDSREDMNSSIIVKDVTANAEPGHRQHTDIFPLDPNHFAGGTTLYVDMELRLKHPPVVIRQTGV